MHTTAGLSRALRTNVGIRRRFAHRSRAVRGDGERVTHSTIKLLSQRIAGFAGRGRRPTIFGYERRARPRSRSWRGPRAAREAGSGLFQGCAIPVGSFDTAAARTGPRRWPSLATRRSLVLVCHTSQLPRIAVSICPRRRSKSAKVGSHASEAMRQTKTRVTGRRAASMGFLFCRYMKMMIRARCCVGMRPRQQG